MKIKDRSHRNLIRRYLLWAYKTTKESFERIERKTTQLLVDEHILRSLGKFSKLDAAQDKEYKKLVDGFKKYIEQKEQDQLKLKYSDAKSKKLRPEYLYLKNRLISIEEAIKYFLGPAELKKIEALFEKEFETRILQAREH